MPCKCPDAKRGKKGKKEEKTSKRQKIDAMSDKHITYSIVDSPTNANSMAV
jgi:hypothetical protein